MSLEDMLYVASVWTLPVLFAITLHEAAHGWVAWRLGDDTAYRLGRVTFNPLRHIDLFGTILLPAMMLFASGGRFMFGAAKPVPVNADRLRNPRWGMVIVAAAGPMSNIMQAVAAGFLLHGAVFLAGADVQLWVGLNLENAILINLWLAVFNMIPLPPLDGGRVAVGLLPAILARPLARLEKFGIVILLAIIFGVPWIGAQMGINLNLFEWLVAGPFAALRYMVLVITGWG
ncbi:MAG: site-2 protease family protein [Proteobacteria bacterium]|nr:site-2 protease family protein [Pseudomonadota bacterium]